jgi:hypothetical protein
VGAALKAASYVLEKMGMKAEPVWAESGSPGPSVAAIAGAGLPLLPVIPR